MTEYQDLAFVDLGNWQLIKSLNWNIGKKQGVWPIADGDLYKKQQLVARVGRFLEIIDNPTGERREWVNPSLLKASAAGWARLKEVQYVLVETDLPPHYVNMEWAESLAWALTQVGESL